MATTQAEEATVLSIERSLNASPEEVFEAWTNEAMLRKWHAPGDYTVAYVEADVKVGGRYRITMRAPKSDVFHTIFGEYREVVRSLPIHEGHHNGEIALIKKLLGQRVEAGAAS